MKLDYTELNLIGLSLICLSLLGVMILAPYEGRLHAILFFITAIIVLGIISAIWLQRRTAALGQLPEHWVFESGIISILGLGAMIISTYIL